MTTEHIQILTMIEYAYRTGFWQEQDEHTYDELVEYMETVHKARKAAFEEVVGMIDELTEYTPFDIHENEYNLGIEHGKQSLAEQLKSRLQEAADD